MSYRAWTFLIVVLAILIVGSLYFLQVGVPSRPTTYDDIGTELGSGRVEQPAAVVHHLAAAVGQGELVDQLGHHHPPCATGLSDRTVGVKSGVPLFDVTREQRLGFLHAWEETDHD